MKTVPSLVFTLVFTAAAPSLVAQITSTVFNPVPSRIVGQPVLQQLSGTVTATAPNLVEGRELWAPTNIAVDTSASPAILYVADYQNNRVLAWKNVSAFTKGDFADAVIGQRDLLTTRAQGPGQDLTQGFFGPVAIVVDSKGNLYVADSGNNRILRFPKPLSQTGSLLVADLVIGQKDFNGRAANEGNPAPSEKTIAIGGLLVGIALDPQGNLWVSDGGNNRVLRFPASALGTNPSNEPSADLVLGQTDFVTSIVPPNTSTTPTNQTKNITVQPAGIAVDPKGRVFVADALARVVVFAPPFTIGTQAVRIMGVIPPTKTQPVPPKINESTLGWFDTSGQLRGSPNGVFFIGSNPYVVDTPNARILGYDTFEQWPDEATAFSPPAKVIVGQPSFQAFLGNRGLPQPTNQTLAGPQVSGTVPLLGPSSAFFAGTDLFVADTGNNRVLVFPQRSGGTFDTATRLLGQLDFPENSLNFIEGREMNFASNTTACSGLFVSGGSVAIDPNSNPPHMYVSDPANNRILGYLDYRKVTAGAKADLVIGQPDLYTSLVNYPSNNPAATTAQGLYAPEGIAVDANGNLYVADACNARVLRFPKPLDQPAGSGIPTANLVLGQFGFNGQPTHDLSRQTMRSSYGVAFTFDGHLVVSDPLANRVLFFRKPAGGDFQSAAAADNVIGQLNFTSGNPVILNAPRLMSLDPDDHLYVADTGNNRIVLFPNTPLSGDNPSILFSITGLSSPFGVTVNKTTRDIWVANFSANQVLRYPPFEVIQTNPGTSANFVSFAPVGIGLDPFGDPVVGEAGVNRVAFFFPAIDFTNAAGGVPGRFSGNAANYFSRFAPGMLAAIFPFPTSKFGDQTVVNSTVPIPTTLGDVQVLVAGVPAPLLYTDLRQINFQVPKGTPVGTFQEIQVVKASTGQVISSYVFKIDPVAPGLFTSSGTGNGQVSAYNNDDGQVNGPAHPVKAGSFIILYGTGQGLVNNMQADGVPVPPNDATETTTQLLRVFINGTIVPDADVTFSGLAPGFVGLWQINARVPDNAAAATQSGVGDITVAIAYSDVTSTLDQFGTRRTTTIRVTPKTP